MEIRNHRLLLDDGSGVPFRESPNRGGALQPEYLVMHYTAGRSAESSTSWLCNPQAQASAHLVIGRTGTVAQLVPFDTVAWHAGKSRWLTRQRLNQWSIGIELDNAGQLVRHPDGWRTYWGATVNASDVIEAAHKSGGPVAGWHTFTQEQLEVAQLVAAVLVSHYGLKDVLGHDDIAPGRKTDPGPAFPMTSFRAAALGRADDDEPEEPEYRTTTGLNIRIGPGTQYEKLAASPLPAGTRIKRLGQQGSWLQVLVLDPIEGDLDVEGWVHGEYVRPA